MLSELGPFDSIGWGNGKKLCAAYIDELRNKPLIEIAGQTVTTRTDYRSGIQYNLESGEERKLEFPSSNVLAYELGEAEM